mgnify:CR=1 FL=1|jgi:hypothetical protein
MEYLKLIETIVASDLVRNILLLMVMLSLWKIQDIIRDVTTYDTSRKAVGSAIKVQTENYYTGN